MLTCRQRLLPGLDKISLRSPETQETENPGTAPGFS